ncbi:MAG: (2Fe-2S)-binding protein [Rhodocyclaceae bacterium]|nr:(2Fe-2S)-binding protein [Rhodocyclaceae bacterium]MBX3669433.1 (2Fe-2S)-binding protein [Rhodocyclaceae bacterium]
MYVCLCQPVTDRDIRSAVAQGCRSMRDLRTELGCCNQCRRCVKAAHEVLTDALTQKHAHLSLLVPA